MSAPWQIVLMIVGTSMIIGTVFYSVCAEAAAQRKAAAEAVRAKAEAEAKAAKETARAKVETERKAAAEAVRAKAAEEAARAEAEPARTAAEEAGRAMAAAGSAQAAAAKKTAGAAANKEDKMAPRCAHCGAVLSVRFGVQHGVQVISCGNCGKALTAEKIAEQAEHYYQRAMELNNPNFHFNNFAPYMRSAAELRHLQAQYEAGCLALLCRPRRMDDLLEALRWFRQAAERGHVAAQNNCGACYWMIEYDIENTLKWLKAAADNGDPMAKRNHEKIIRIAHPGTIIPDGLDLELHAGVTCGRT